MATRSTYQLGLKVARFACIWLIQNLVFMDLNLYCGDSRCWLSSQYQQYLAAGADCMYAT
eukprot:scaffold663312_cov65-Prasinocladus_malaysianus.AAC.1